MEELLKMAVDCIDDYLNAGTKEARRAASIKAKKVYEEYHKKPYINRYMKDPKKLKNG